MRILNRSIYFVLLLSLFSPVVAQTDSTKTTTSAPKAETKQATTTTATTTTTKKAAPKPVNIEEGAISEQYEFIVDKSSSWENYKVIKKTLISQFRKNLNDSLGQHKATVKGLNETIANKDTQLKEKQNAIDGLKAKLDELQKQKDSVKLLGTYTSKGTYNSIMWSMVIILLILSGILFILFKRSHAVTRETKETLAFTQEEFETHRKSALRREQKLARELHNEKNKYRT